MVITKLHLLLSQGFSPALAFCHTPDWAAIGTVFNIFSYDIKEGRDSNPLSTRQEAQSVVPM